MTDAEGEILTLGEVGAYQKTDQRSVYRLAQKNKVYAFKSEGAWRFCRTELDNRITESINRKKSKIE